MQGVTVTYIVMFFFGIYFLMLFALLSVKNKKAVYYSPKPTIFPKISIIIPAYNEQDTILETIDAVLKIDYPEAKKEIIIVNDGSKDNTQKIVEEFIAKNRDKNLMLLNKINSGKADSLNAAIKISSGELIAVVDADSYPAKESLMKMIGFFEEDKQVAAVTSRVLVKNQKNYIEKFQEFDYEIIAWDRKILDFINCVYVTNGPLSVYRKDLIQQVGGFDKKVLTEDIEITWNLLSKGYKTKMAYSAEAYTSVPDNFRQWNNQRIRWNLGGLQTWYKYKNCFMKGKNLFGYFVMNYVFLSFILAFLGIFMLIRFLAIKVRFYALTLPYLLQGYSPFSAIDFNLSITLVFILGMMFTVLGVGYYKFIIKNGNIKNKSIFSLLVYIFIYRSFYMIPLAISVYKMIKGDIRWYTK